MNYPFVSEIIECSHCGQPKRQNAWCPSLACAERVAKAQAELRALIMGDATVSPAEEAPSE